MCPFVKDCVEGKSILCVCDIERTLDQPDSWKASKQAALDVIESVDGYSCFCFLLGRRDKREISLVHERVSYGSKRVSEHTLIDS